jgi:hypothetical protein
MGASRQPAGSHTPFLMQLTPKGLCYAEFDSYSGACLMAVVIGLWSLDFIHRIRPIHCFKVVVAEFLGALLTWIVEM